MSAGDIMDTKKLLKEARIKRGLTMKQVSEMVGVSESTISRWESGAIANMTREKIVLLSDALHISPSDIMGWTDSKPADDGIVILDDVQFYPTPIFESVAAGFSAHADSKIIGYNMLPYKTKYEAENSMQIRVQGDSMFPKIEDGDSVVVLKQTSVDSGEVAVVLIDGEDGVVKKVVYDKDWVELHSFNPMYPVRRFEGADVQRIRVMGKVTKVIKEM